MGAENADIEETTGYVTVTETRHFVKTCKIRNEKNGER